MSTNKTSNYNLHSWVGTDPVKRTEFNENFQIIDEELAAHQADTTFHITAAERASWNAKETPSGAQAKADQALAAAKAYADAVNQYVNLTAGEAITAGTPVMMKNNETLVRKAVNLLTDDDLGLSMDVVMDSVIKVLDSTTGYTTEVAIEAIDANRILVVWIKYKGTTPTGYGMYASIGTLDHTTGKVNFTGSIYNLYSGSTLSYSRLKLKKMPNGDIVCFYVTGEGSTNNLTLYGGWFTPGSGSSLTFTLGYDRMNYIGDTDNRIIIKDIQHVTGNTIIFGYYSCQTNTMYGDYRIGLLQDYKTTVGVNVLKTMGGQDSLNTDEYGTFLTQVSDKRYVAVSWDADTSSMIMNVFSMTGASFTTYSQESTLSVPSVQPIGVFTVNASKVLVVCVTGNDLVFYLYTLNGGIIDGSSIIQGDVVDAHQTTNPRFYEVVQLTDRLFLYRNNSRRIIFSVADKAIAVLEDFIVPPFSGAAGTHTSYYTPASSVYVGDRLYSVFEGYSTGSYGLTAMSIKVMPYTIIGINTGAVSNGGTAKVQTKGKYTTSGLTPGSYYSYDGTSLVRTFKQGNAIGKAISATELLLF